MSVDIGKPADQVKQDAQKDIQAALPDEASKSAAADQLAASMNDPEVKKKAYEDVKHLAETIRNIRANFIKVAGDLVGFDAAGFKDKHGQLIKLGPKWQPHIKEFDDTLQYSLEQATDAITMMKSITAILGDVTPDLKDDLMIELKYFMQTLEKKEADSLKVKDRFQNLADNVELFSAEVDAALDKAEEAIKIDLTKAKNRLADLQRELKDINEKLRSLGVATATELAVGGVAAVVAVVTLNPVAIFAAIGSLFAAIATGIAIRKAKAERDRCQSEIDQTNREIQALNDRLELLKKYRSTLEGTKVIIHDISEQVAVIANIWQTINLDMHALYESLSANVGDDVIITKFWLKKLGVAKELYSHLTYLLETYVEQVHVANA